MMTCALAYAQLGMRVFPVAANCRKPMTAHGYKDATADPKEIERLWPKGSKSQIAVATGHVSGVFVLDVDVKGADGHRTLAQLQAANGYLPPTWCTRTPSGGLHLWFRQPDRPLRNRVGFAPGLDVRTDGGSVAVPPSRRWDGEYAWEISPWAIPVADSPGWLLDLIDPPSVARPCSPPIQVGSVDGLTRYATAAIADETRRLASMAPNTGRNMQLFKAAANLGELVGAGVVPAQVIEDALVCAATACGLVADDGQRAVMATIKSGLGRGVAQPRVIIK